MVGDPVKVSVSWERDGERLEVPAEELFTHAGQAPPSNVWVYTGSRYARGQKYMAETDGTIIGFVHDPASIIEHREGIGLGDYGAAALRPGILPKPGATVWLTVRRMPEALDSQDLPSGSAGVTASEEAPPTKPEGGE